MPRISSAYPCSDRYRFGIPGRGVRGTASDVVEQNQAEARLKSCFDEPPQMLIAPEAVREHDRGTVLESANPHVVPRLQAHVLILPSLVPRYRRQRAVDPGRHERHRELDRMVGGRTVRRAVSPAGRTVRALGVGARPRSCPLSSSIRRPPRFARTSIAHPPRAQSRSEFG